MEPAYGGKRSVAMMTSLAVLFALSVWAYGTHVLFSLFVAVVTAAACDFVINKYMLKALKYIPDSEPVIYAMMITLLLPASAKAWLIILTILFGLLVAYYPFGGKGKNIFNPVSAGLCFAGLCWGEHVFDFPKFSARLFDGSTGFTTSPESTLAIGGVPHIKGMNGLLGLFPGPMGATFILVIAACAVFLLACKAIKWQVPVIMVIVSCYFAWAMPRISADAMASITFETIAGVWVFGTIFLASDPATTPKTGMGRVYFGLILGMLTMLFRYRGLASQSPSYQGINEYGFLYALLIANALAPSCDKLGSQLKALLGRVKEKGKTEGAEA